MHFAHTPLARTRTAEPEVSDKELASVITEAPEVALKDG